MKISCIQMNVRVGQPNVNASRVEALVKRAVRHKPDVIVLPELWNTGFAPRKIDRSMADNGGVHAKALCGRLAKEHGVNIVAGSVLRRAGNVFYNTAYVFDRAGNCIAEYNKTHLFSPSGEGEAYTAGDRLVTFPLDGVRCGILICYDLRFGELSRALALSGAKALFIPAEWRREATEQMLALLRARAIEDQVFAALCNGCGEAHGTTFGGKSAIIDPLGKVLARAGRGETILSAAIDFAAQEKARLDLPVFSDRRPDLYTGLFEANRS